MAITPKLLPAVTLDRTWAIGRPLIGCRFDPSGRFLFASAEDDSIRRLDMLTGEAITFTAHKSWVRGMVFLSETSQSVHETIAFERKKLAVRAASGPAATALTPPTPKPITAVSGDYHGNLIWWDAHQPKPRAKRIVSAHDGWIRALAANAKGNLFASCGNDHLVKVWSVASGEELFNFKNHDSHVYNVAFHPDGKLLASCDLKGIVNIWDTSTGSFVKRLDAAVLHKYDQGFMADIGGARGMNYDPQTGRLACCGITNVSNAFAGVGNPIVAVFDGKDGKPKLLKPTEAFQGTAWGVDFHPQGFVIAAGGGSGGRLWMWYRGESRVIKSTNIPANVRDLSLHPAGDRVALAGANGTAYIYRLEDPNPVGKKS